MRSDKYYALTRFLKVADAASKALGKGDFCTYMRIDLMEFLHLSYSDRFTVADINEGAACIAADEWDQSNFVMSMERDPC
jgi:hypothetical protein